MTALTIPTLQELRDANGTAGLEIIRGCPDIDTIIVPFGGNIDFTVLCNSVRQSALKGVSVK